MKNVSDLIESNGKTVKENNLSKKHNVPFGTLVEIDSDNDNEKLRVYVVGHTRDCDGEPLYQFSYDKYLAEWLEKELQNNNGRKTQFYVEHQGAIFGAHQEECIKVVSNDEINIDADKKVGELINFKGREGDILRAYVVKKEENGTYYVSHDKNAQIKKEQHISDKKFLQKMLEEIRASRPLNKQDLEEKEMSFRAVCYFELIENASIMKICVE